MGQWQHTRQPEDLGVPISAEVKGLGTKRLSTATPHKILDLFFNLIPCSTATPHKILDLFFNLIPCSFYIMYSPTSPSTGGDISTEHKQQAVDGVAQPRSLDIDLHPSSALLARLGSNVRRPGRKSVLIITGPLVGAVSLAVGHHLYLYWLHGRNVDNQIWARNISNLLAQIVVILLTVAVTHSMTQVIWQVLRTTSIKISVVNTLFELPSLLQTAMLVRSSTTYPHVIGPFLFAIGVHALFVVTTLAPNALQVASRQPLHTLLRVPNLDLTQGPPIWEADEHNCWNRTDGIAICCNTGKPLPLWSASVGSAMSNPPFSRWQVPEGCGVACSYELQYYAPALQCDRKANEETILNALSVNSSMTRSHFLLTSWMATSSYSIENKTTKDFTFTAAYFHAPYELRQHPEERPDLSTGYDLAREYMKEATHCRFMNGTYKMRFSSSNGRMTVNTTLLSYGKSLGGQTLCVDGKVDLNGYLYRARYRAMCEAFASKLTGTTYASQGIGSFPQVYSFAGSPNLFAGDPSVLQVLFNMSMYPPVEPDQLELVYPTLGKALMDLFTNFTLAIIPRRTETTLVNATVWDGSNVWDYNDKTLWTVYGPALFICSLFSLIGLWCIKLNGTGLEADFTTLTVRTRNAQLDQVLNALGSIEEFEQVKLRHQRKGTLLVDESSKPLLRLQEQKREKETVSVEYLSLPLEEYRELDLSFDDSRV